METQNFVMVNPSTSKLETIKIPQICPHCKSLIKTVKPTFVHDIEDQQYLISDPCEHFMHYHSVWSNRIEKIEKVIYNCKKCNMQNPWAEANQKDGTYLCFSCR